MHCSNPVAGFSTVLFNAVLILFLLSGFNIDQNAQEMFVNTSCEIEPRSQLKIHGTSNVTGFTCISLESHDKKNISFFWDDSRDKLVLQHTELDLRIKEMDCGGRGINRDFYKTLQADQYPIVSIIIRHVTLSGDLNNGSDQHAIANTVIGLAGATKEVNISIGIEKLAEGKFHVVGLCPLNMSDFGIEPPTALFGLIKVDDRIDIDLNLYLTIDHLQ